MVVEAMGTGYFKNSRNRYGSGRYVTDLRRKGSRTIRGRAGRIIRFIVFLCVILAGWFLYAQSQRDRMNANPEDVIFSSDEPSRSVVDAAPGLIPEYAGFDRIVLNDNIPNFTAYDFGHIEGEIFSDPDILGRCRAAAAMLDRSMMPTAERGPIGDVKPSGWNQKKYPGIIDSQPPYLYNRCHLIAYALTGQNANHKNLITGTRHLNADLMLPYEIQVAQYLDRSENHVLYRVSPYFCGLEMVARGVEMEAYSVEDNGEGVCFHVFLYNVQPGIEIDYLTGWSTQVQ